MGYGIPSDRFPKPALPSEIEARRAVEVFVEVHRAKHFAADQDSEVMIDMIYLELLKPLLDSLEEWRDRAVERRKDYSYVADRLRVIRDAACEHNEASSPSDVDAIRHAAEDQGLRS